MTGKRETKKVKREAENGVRGKRKEIRRREIMKQINQEMTKEVLAGLICCLEEIIETRKGV